MTGVLMPGCSGGWRYEAGQDFDYGGHPTRVFSAPRLTTQRSLRFGARKPTPPGAALARASAAYQPSSYNDAIAQRDRLTTLLDGKRW